MKTHPQVSINLPVRNGAAALRRRLASIAEQTFTDFRVIITDNASEDETASICLEYEDRDPRFQYYRNHKDMGLSFSLARGLYCAGGSEYVTYTSHSDFWDPRYLEKCVKALEENPTAVLSYSHCRFHQPDGTEMMVYKDDFDLTGPDAGERFLKVVGAMGMCTAFYGLMRLRTYLEDVELMIPKGSAADDNVALATLALSGPFIQIAEPLYFREIPTYRDQNYADRYKRIHAMEHSDKAPKPLGGIWPYINFIEFHLIAIRKSRLPLDQQDRLCQMTVNILMERYKKQIHEEMQMNVDQILKGRQHANPIFDEEGGPSVGQYRFLDFSKNRYLLTLLNQARPYGGDRVPGFHHARALVLVQLGYQAEALNAVEMELKRDPVYRSSLELKSQLTSAR